MTAAIARARCKAVACGAVALALTVGLSALPALAATPQIRASATNTVPQCVTPQRLMAFLKSRNPDIDPRFASIASLYKRYGEAWRVRWDYAFFQMAVETNFLSFKRGDGRWGDVKPRQNNFAGLGTTGGGVPGDSFPDIATGVLAQIQHLVVYSGEHVADPVGPRTKLKQDDILESTAHLKGQTTFADLSRRWAADRHYGAAIEWVAGNYRATYCTAAMAKADAARSASAKVATHLAKANSELPPATALGGPGASKSGDAEEPPVRTIWSRSDQPRAANTEPAPRPAKRSAQTPPTVPEKAPAPAAAASEPSQAAAIKEPIVVPTPVEVRPRPKLAPPQPVLRPATEEPPRAFAFAAAMVATASAAPAADGARCRVFSASYGGTKTLLVRARAEGELRYTALTVLDGFEDSMLAGYLKVHAPGGSRIGTFDTRDAAIAKASELCPGAADAPPGEAASAG
jgi:hypothetical protein